MIKKYAVASVIAAAGAFMLAGAAQAATMSIPTKFQISAEKLGAAKKEALSSGSPVSGKTISMGYVSSINMNPDDIITFQLTNAKFQDQTLYLLQNGVSATWVKVGDLISSGTTTNAAFRLTNSGITTGGLLGSGNTWRLSKTAAPATTAAIAPPPIQVNAGLAAGATIKLAVTEARTGGGTALPGARASATAVGVVKNEFSMTAGATTDTIDVNAAEPRTLFEGPTSLSQAGVWWSVASAAGSTIDDRIQGSGTYTLSFTLTPSTDFSGIDSVQGFASTSSWDVGTTSATGSTTNGATGITGGTQKVVVAVDGSTALETREFDMTAALNFSNANYVDESYDLGTTHTWDINGWQGFVNYMNADPAYSTFVKISNRSADVAQVFVDVFDDAGNVYATHTLGTVGAQATSTFLASDIRTALSIPGTAFSALFTVTVPETQVAATAVQRSTTGQRVLPIYTSAGASEAWKY